MRYVALVALSSLMACGAFKPHVTDQPTDLDRATSAYLVQGDIDAARAQLQSLAAPDDASAEATFLLADLLDATGAPGEALPMYFKTLASAHAQGRHDDAAIAAAMAVVAIRDRVDAFEKRLESFLSSLGHVPGRLPAEAWYQLKNLRAALIRRQGDLKAADKALAEVGCPTRWRIAGPVGPWVWSAFDTTHPLLESRASWPATLDLGPGRGLVPIRTVVQDICFTDAGNPAMPLDGVTYARTLITRRSAGIAHIRLQTTGAIAVRIGGRELFRRDSRRASWPDVSWISASLPAGTVDIVVKLATAGTSPSFSMVILDENLRPAYEDDTPDGTAIAGKVQLVDDKHAEGASVAEHHKRSAVAYAQLKAALWWDDIPRALRFLADFREKGGVLSPVLSQLMAEARTADPDFPGDLAYERARRLLADANEREPRLWYARIGLADREMDEDRVREAIKLLEDGRALTPGEPQIIRRLAGIFLDRGWFVEASAAVSRLTEVLPSACNTFAWQRALATQRSEVGRARALAEKIAACDAFSTSLAESMALSQEWKGVFEESKRLRDLSPRSVTAAVDVAAAAMALGDLKADAEALGSALVLAPVNVPLLLGMADSLAAAGDRSRADEVLEGGLLSPVGDKPVMLEALAALDQTDLLSEIRVDGLEVIARYQEAVPAYDSSAVFVLDRAVYRIYDDGSILMVVHTITHLKTDEAVEKYGELSLPADATLLTARTIKADGRIMEPEEIAGKSSLSMPNLEPGDFVESEFVLFKFPNQIFPGGFDTERFYFKDFETAFHRSEMVVIVPRGTSVITDPRGPCPPMRETALGDLRVLTWQTRDAQPHPEEPFSPDATEFLPSIRVVGHATWENLLLRVHDMLADKDRRSWVIDDALKEALAGVDAKDHTARKRAIYHWVMDNIESSGDMFAQAGHIIAAKSGNRARAFAAMAKRAGYSARLVLVKPSGADETVNPSPSLSLFNELGVDVPGDGIMDFDHEYAPYGFLAPRLRHRPAIYIDNGKSTMAGDGTVPYDTQDVEITLTLTPDGSASGHVRERLTGIFAAEWRKGLQTNNVGERDRMFQGAYLATAIPGAVLRGLDIAGRDNRDAPLVLDYDVVIPQFAKREGRRLRVEVPFQTNIGKQTGGLPQRTTALVLGLRVKKSVTAVLTLPTGFKLVKENGWERQVGGELGKGVSRATKDLNRLRLRYDVTLESSRIEPGRYMAFLVFARDMDLLSKMSVLLDRTAD